MILLEIPRPAVEEGKAFFPESGRFGRHQAPAIPSPPVPLPLEYLHQELPLPLASATPRSIWVGDHRSPKINLSPEAPSAAELAAGDFLHLRRPCDHRKDRLGVADPSLLLDAREKTPFAGDDRRTPRLGSGREEEGVGTGET